MGVSWGWCGPDCATHNESISWSADETFKTTLQYDNSLMKFGLELYGVLFAGILICGLMIVLVLAAGRYLIIFSFVSSSRMIRT